MMCRHTTLLCWLVLHATVLHFTNATARFACYGTNLLCDYYTLSCNDSEIIRIKELNVGRKPYNGCLNTYDHCINKSVCCEHNAQDVEELFNLENTYNAYTNCSGRNRCENIHAPWQMMSDSTTSTYVNLEYGCEKVSEKVPICGGESKNISKSSNYLELMFDSSVENFNASKTSKVCQCKVTSQTTQTITLKTIDVRLQSYFKSENQSSAKCSSVIFKYNDHVLTCNETEFHYKYNFLYANQYQVPITLTENNASYITLQNLYMTDQTDSPAMAWLSLESENQTIINAECYEVMPADLISATVTIPADISTSTKITLTTIKPTSTTLITSTILVNISTTSASSSKITEAIEAIVPSTKSTSDMLTSTNTSTSKSTSFVATNSSTTTTNTPTTVITTMVLTKDSSTPDSTIAPTRPTSLTLTTSRTTVDISTTSASASKTSEVFQTAVSSDEPTADILSSTPTSTSKSTSFVATNSSTTTTNTPTTVITTMVLTKDSSTPDSTIAPTRPTSLTLTTSRTTVDISTTSASASKTSEAFQTIIPTKESTSDLLTISTTSTLKATSFVATNSSVSAINTSATVITTMIVTRSSSTTSTAVAGNALRNAGADEKHREKVMLAIFITVVVVVTVAVIVFLWLYWRSYYPSKRKFYFKKRGPVSKVINASRNFANLDLFDVQSNDSPIFSSDKPEYGVLTKLPIGGVYCVPDDDSINLSTWNISTQGNRPYSIQSELSIAQSLSSTNDSEKNMAEVQYVGKNDIVNPPIFKSNAANLITNNRDINQTAVGESRQLISQDEITNDNEYMPASNLEKRNNVIIYDSKGAVLIRVDNSRFPTHQSESADEECNINK